MTTNNTENAMGGVTITEADRKAACTEFARRFGGTVSQHLAVLDDAHPLTQAFAKHRIAARQAALEEMERACTAAQYSPHPYTDLKHAICKLKAETTPPANNTEG